MTAYTILRERIPEIVVPGKALGRHIHWDSRSDAYLWRRLGVPVTSKLWGRSIPILNQGDVGACTGNALTGALGTAPLFQALNGDQQSLLGEQEALSLYSAAEVIDGDGPYPPKDNGSNGTSVCQAAKNAGLIAGYLHCQTVEDMNDALQTGPVIVGVNWYDGFDNPSSSGFVEISGSVRGGHEFLVRGTSTTTRLFSADNSWGTGWGVGGSFAFTWDTMNTLLAQQGDCTVPLPLTSPAPQPGPVVSPTGVVASEADLDLLRAFRVWQRAKGL